jgi:hypothetical protein
MALLSLRNADDATKQELVEVFGGDDETLLVVRRGLDFLQQQQHEDGRWRLHQYNRQFRNQRLPRLGRLNCDTAATGLALLPFLGDGHTHASGSYQKTVLKGLQWLTAHQREDGDLYTGGDRNSHMYAHAIATIALTEAYALSQEPTLVEPTQRALNFIILSQHSRTGGWRYQPGEEGDTSVVGWQVMALKSGQMAGLNVPDGTFAGAEHWLRRVEGTGTSAGRFGYVDRRPTPAMTAEALLCLQFLGAGRDDPRLRLGLDYLSQYLPGQSENSSYYWYYATQVMFHAQGEQWTQWNDAVKTQLLPKQTTRGLLAGSWDPDDQWENQAGRIYATSLRLLMLEVYYRHLPLYRALRDDS